MERSSASSGSSNSQKYTVEDLMSAARVGDVNKVEQVLQSQQIDINSKSSFGWTALHEAACRGHRDLCEWLVERGGDVQEKNDYGSTALHKAAGRGYRDLCEWLVERGGDVQEKDNKGQTALHLAARWRHEAVVDLLLGKGADMTVRDENGQTALHLAACWGHEAVIDLLLNKGADVTAQDNLGQTALDVALKNDHIKTATVLNSDTEWLFQYCARKSYIEAMKSLCHKLQNVNIRVEHNTPLLVASKHGWNSEVDILLQKGANVSDVNDDGDSALHLAIRSGNMDIINNLLKHGAEMPTVTDFP